MRLVTAQEAAAELFVSRGTVQYWVRTGKLAKHPFKVASSTTRSRKYTESPRRFLVDVDEAKRMLQSVIEKEIKEEHADKRLLYPAEAARIMEVTTTHTLSLIRRFGVTKYSLGYGNKFLIDGDELADALEANGLEYLVK
jgi:hypothetical protein